MTSRSGSPSVPLARSVARCSTPKRCCSSITTTPSEPNATSSVKQGVRPDHDAHRARGQALEHGGAGLALDPAGEQLDAHLAARHAAGALEVAQEGAHGDEVLFGQHLGGHHQGALVPALHRGEQRGQRHHGLARADVALQQAVHRERPGHVGHDHGQGPALGLGELVGQAGQEARHQRVAHPAGDLARRHGVVQRAGVDLEGPPAQHQGQLQPEELVEDQAAPGRLDHLERLGPVNGPEGVGAVPQVDGARHSAGSGSANSPARSSASATNSPISHDVSPALAEAGYTGRMRSVRRPGVTPATTSTTGLVIWRVPRYSVTLPKKMASVPGSSCLARQGWLKNTIFSRPVSSRTTTSTTARPVRARRAPAPTARWPARPPRRRPGGPRRRPGGCGRCSGAGRCDEIEDGLDAELGQPPGLALGHRLEHGHLPQAQVAECAAATQSPTGTGREAGRPGAPRPRRRGTPR